MKIPSTRMIDDMKLRLFNQEVNRFPYRATTRLGFILVGRASHRLDEMARCLTAAIWGDVKATIDITLFLLSPDGGEVSLVKVDVVKFKEAVGPVPDEETIIKKVLQLGKRANKHPTLKECILTESFLQQYDDNSDVLVELHEDAQLTLASGFSNSNLKNSQKLSSIRKLSSEWNRTLWLFGVHEDFLKEVRTVREHLQKVLQHTIRVSLGPVSLHSSACVHVVCGFLTACRPSIPHKVFDSIAEIILDDKLNNLSILNPRLRVSLDLECGMRCVPDRGAIHFFIKIDNDSLHPNITIHLSTIAAIWASKSTYRSRDTKLHLIYESDVVKTYDRTLLDYMPRQNDDGKAPNNKNVLLALEKCNLEMKSSDVITTLLEATCKKKSFLVLECSDSHWSHPLHVDDEFISCSDPRPREEPLFCFVNSRCPDLSEISQQKQVVKMSTCIRGSSTTIFSIAIPRVILTLQGLHSLGRLKGLVRKYGSCENQIATSTSKNITASEVLNFWNSEGFELQREPSPGDEIITKSPTWTITAPVAAVRAQGTMAFLGVLTTTNDRIQVICPLRDWPIEDIHSIRKAHAGDYISLIATSGYTPKGRLSLFASKLISHTVGEPIDHCNPTLIKTYESFLTCIKPSGKVTHLTSTTRSGDRPTVACLATKMFNDGGRLYPVHLVEKDTSGLTLFSKDSKKTETLSEMLRVSAKQFIVVASALEGVTLPAQGDTWINEKPLKEVVREKKDGKAKKSANRRQASRIPTEARTVFKCLVEIPSAKAVILLAKPETSCTRQIRRHLSDINLYIVGDHLQGTSLVNRNFAKTYSFTSTAIHFYSATNPKFCEMGSNEETLSSPLPAELKSFICSMPWDKKSVIGTEFSILAGL